MKVSKNNVSRRTVTAKFLTIQNMTLMCLAKFWLVARLIQWRWVITCLHVLVVGCSEDEWTIVKWVGKDFSSTGYVWRSCKNIVDKGDTRRGQAKANGDIAILYLKHGEAVAFGDCADPSVQLLKTGLVFDLWLARRNSFSAFLFNWRNVFIAVILGCDSVFVLFLFKWSSNIVPLFR